MIFQGKCDIIFNIIKKGIIKMNIEEKLLQAKSEIAFQKIYNEFKKFFSKNLNEIFSVFEDKKIIKRFQNNQIYIFEDTEMLILDPIGSDKTSYRVFRNDFYRITYLENELVIEYFVLNREIIKDEEFTENIEKWNIKDFNFCDNLENFHIKYEIRLGEKSSFKSIKKQKNI